LLTLSGNQCLTAVDVSREKDCFNQTLHIFESIEIATGFSNLSAVEPELIVWRSLSLSDSFGTCTSNHSSRMRCIKVQGGVTPPDKGIRRYNLWNFWQFCVQNPAFWCMFCALSKLLNGNIGSIIIDKVLNTYYLHSLIFKL
jgi:hypothetical protein